MPNYFGTVQFPGNPFDPMLNYVGMNPEFFGFPDWGFGSNLGKGGSSTVASHYWNLGYLNPQQGLNTPLLGSAEGAQAALNQFGSQGPGASNTISVKSRTGPSEQLLQNILNKVLDEYQKAYNEYKQAVEGRYQEAKGLAQQQYARLMPQMTALQNQLIPEWRGRTDYSMNLLQGLGEQALKDIETAYKEKGGEISQNLVNRGLTASTIPTSAGLLLEGEKQDAIGREKERIRQQLLQTYLQTSRDALDAHERLGLTGINTDRTLTKDIIDIIANREDIPPDLSQLIALAQLAGQGIASQEINVSGSGSGGAPSSGGGTFPLMGSTGAEYPMPYFYLNPRITSPPEEELKWVNIFGGVPPIDRPPIDPKKVSSTTSPASSPYPEYLATAADMPPSVPSADLEAQYKLMFGSDPYEDFRKQFGRVPKDWDEYNKFMGQKLAQRNPQDERSKLYAQWNAFFPEMNAFGNQFLAPPPMLQPVI